MKCKKCNQEVYSLHLDNICFNCWYAMYPEVKSINPMAHDLMNKMNRDYLSESIEEHIKTTKEVMKKYFLKVQFFEDISLITIQNQMNKFFEDEDITTVTRIEYLKDSHNRYSVMVVYA